MASISKETQVAERFRDSIVDYITARHPSRPTVDEQAFIRADVATVVETWTDMSSVESLEAILSVYGCNAGDLASATVDLSLGWYRVKLALATHTLTRAVIRRLRAVGLLSPGV